jgi:hypothetical protein
MSYITGIKGEEVRNSLIAKQDKLLADIRKIVGGKKFTFSEAYIKKAHPKIGVGEMSYGTITKKYIYVSCFLQHNNNEDCTEYGAIIKKYPICYNRATGSFVEKVELEDLFISDLEKILNEIKFYLWWESCVNLPKVRAEYERLMECEKKYLKMKKDLGYTPQNDDDFQMSIKKMLATLDKKDL